MELPQGHGGGLCLPQGCEEERPGAGRPLEPRGPVRPPPAAGRPRRAPPEEGAGYAQASDGH
eukprot:4467344-Pyramimonas_sp.AAC.1